MNSKWIIGLNVKSKTMKPIEKESVGDYPYHLEIGKDFFRS